jgi:hypothetical protein
MYFAIAPETATGFVNPGVQTMFAAGMVNLKRDPFEMGWGDEKKTSFWFSGALAGPVTAYIYDWNLLPIGQILWLKELETYKEFPPFRIRRATTWIRSWNSSRRVKGTRASSSDACARALHGASAQEKERPPERTGRFCGDERQILPPH